MPKDYDVIVIGAGNGGRAAGAFTAKNGKKTLVVEKHNIPGGSATSFVRGRFEFETSLHELCTVGTAENPGGIRKFFDMLGADNFQKYQERGNIEVAPLAYMRGRTLDDSFIILDEAQNTTPEQMKMFLTRLGFNSKAIITGDVTQIDLPDARRSGLVEASKILREIPDIAICRFSEKDVVRHRLVQDIIKAYEKYYSKQEAKQDAARRSK